MGTHQFSDFLGAEIRVTLVCCSEPAKLFHVFGTVEVRCACPTRAVVAQGFLFVVPKMAFGPELFLKLVISSKLPKSRQVWLSAR